MEKGIKFDKGKLQWSLLPLGPVAEVVRVMMAGAKKYSVDNWKIVEDAKERYSDAAMRHLTAYLDGETLDSETKLHHLAHLTCCALFLMWFDGIKGINKNRFFQFQSGQPLEIKIGNEYKYDGEVVELSHVDFNKGRGIIDFKTGTNFISGERLWIQLSSLKPL